MSAYIDQTYINRVSPTLRNFKWKNSTLANCSCPICGDSEKNKTKARGYFYCKENSYFYKCHNCGHGCSIYNFLQKVSHQLAKEYSLERWKSGKDNGKNPKREDDMFNILKQKPKFKRKDKVLECIKCLTDLPNDHVAVQFANVRLIPKQHWGLLYYAENFSDFVKELDPSCTVGNEERLIIPFFNQQGDVVGCQGRALDMNSEVNARNTIKYITVKYDKSIDRLWYGLWRVNPKKRVYVVEGPIDSLFLQNATALVGAGALKDIPSRLGDSEMTYILDNEPRNKHICAYIERLIELGRDVCIWPDNIKEKDINDMAYKMSTRKIQKMIDDNTVSGLEAKLRFSEWRKI
jgi:hypothetical protein